MHLPDTIIFLPCDSHHIPSTFVTALCSHSFWSSRSKLPHNLSSEPQSSGDFSFKAVVPNSNVVGDPFLTSSSRFLTDTWSGGHLELAATPKHLGPTAALVAVLQTIFFFLIFNDRRSNCKVGRGIVKGGETPLMYPGRGQSM